MALAGHRLGSRRRGTFILHLQLAWLNYCPGEWTRRLQPFVFVGPAMAMLIWFLALPALRTFCISLFGRNGPPSLPSHPALHRSGRIFSAPFLLICRA